MDRGAWQATVHWIPRVRHDLATKPHINNHININGLTNLDEQRLTFWFKKKKKDPSIYPGYKKSTLHVITSLEITMTHERI